MFGTKSKPGCIFVRELDLREPVKPPPRSDLRGQLRELCEADFEIFADTCTLLHEGGLKLLEAAERVFPNYRKKLNIFASVLAEVNKVGNKFSEKRRTANIILQKLGQLEKKGVVRILEAGNKSFSDVNFISEFMLISSEKGTHRLLLITQDKALAEKINNLSTYLGEVVRNKSCCEARRLDKNGRLEQFAASETPHNSRNAKNKEDTHYDECKILFGPLFRFK